MTASEINQQMGMDLDAPEGVLGSREELEELSRTFGALNGKLEAGARSRIC